MVQSHEIDFLTSLGSTQLKRAVVAVVELSFKDEQFWEIGSHKGNAHLVGVGVNTGVLQDVCHLYCHLVRAGHGVITLVVLVVIVTVFYLYVVGAQVVHLEPSVKVGNLLGACLDDTLVREIILTARRGDKQCCSHQQQRKYDVLFHWSFVFFCFAENPNALFHTSQAVCFYRHALGLSLLSTWVRLEAGSNHLERHLHGTAWVTHGKIRTV